MLLFTALGMAALALRRARGRWARPRDADPVDAAHTRLVLAGVTAAGWVGGGGLLLIPTLLLAAPGVPVATVLGTDKLA